MKDYAFLAEMIVRAGGHWIGLDFDGGVSGGEVSRIAPVGGRAAAVEHARGSEREGAGAD